MRTIITLTDESFIEAFWNVPMRDDDCDAMTGDFLAILYRDNAASPWKITCRLREYRDDKAWGSKDSRTAYEIAPKSEPISDAARDHLATQMDALTTDMASRYGTEVVKRVIHGDARAFSAAFSALPFAHVRTMRRT